MQDRKIRVLELAGTPYDMGFQHGRLHRGAIRDYARERVRLSGLPGWTGRNSTREDVLAVAGECLTEHRLYAPDLVEELQGMADAMLVLARAVDVLTKRMSSDAATRKTIGAATGETKRRAA